MQFTVPQFIEKEPKIVGPFTFKQFIFIGIAGGVCIFLYFTVPLPVFIITAAILLTAAFALAFLKIKGIPLPAVIKNFFFFLFKPKIYLWKKKGSNMIVFKKDMNPPTNQINKKEETNKKQLSVSQRKGKLGELFIHIETRK